MGKNLSYLHNLVLDWVYVPIVYVCQVWFTLGVKVYKIGL